MLVKLGELTSTSFGFLLAHITPLCLLCNIDNIPHVKLVFISYGYIV